MKANTFFVVFKMTVPFSQKKKQVLFVAKSRLFFLKPMQVYLPEPTCLLSFKKFSKAYSNPAAPLPVDTVRDQWVCGYLEVR